MIKEIGLDVKRQ